MFNFILHTLDLLVDPFVSSMKSNHQILFDSLGCGHCNKMKPAYTEAANEMLNQDHVIAAVDCTKNRLTASKYNIEGYPTLKHFNKEKPVDYEGGRSKAEIMSYLLR